MDNGSYDPDQDPISFELSPSGPYNVGTTPVVLTVNDTVGGGVSVATATITVVDETAPAITGADIVVSSDPGQCGAIVNHNASASDNCGPVDFSCSHESGSLFPIGTTTVNCVAIDQAGLVTQHSFTVTVEDNEVPTITVADIVAGNAPGECGAVVSFNPQVTDNCGVADVAISHASGSAFPVGTTPVTVTATDVNGNVSQETVNVTVNDIEPPVIVPVTQPADLTRWTSEPPGAGVWTVDSSGATVLQSVNGLATFFYSDFGALSGVELSGGITVKTRSDDDYIGIALGFEPGDTSDANADYLLIDWKHYTQNHPWGAGRVGLAVSRVKGAATDANFWAHTGAVTELARGITLSNTGWRDLTSYTFTFDYSATRLKVYINGQLEIDIAAPANDPFPNGRFAFYNFSQSHVEYQGVAVTPTLTDITLECNTHGGATNVDLGSAVATDNCDAAPVISNDAPAFFPLGTTLVTWTATDATGNATTILQNVTVVDNNPPVINGLADTVVPNAPGRCDAPVDFAAEVEDCSPVNVTYSVEPGSVFPVGSTPVTVTATDAAGNTSSATFSVTVLDAEAPVVDIHPDITVGNDPGECGAIVSFEVGATDNCGVLSVTSSPASGTLFPLGTTTVDVVAADNNGNVSVGSFNVTVNDTEAPVFGGAGAATFPAPASALGNVAEAAGYDLLYSLNIPDSANWDTPSQVPYTANNSGSISGAGIQRVAYYMELESAQFGSQWVWVSMDAFTTDVSKLGIPADTIQFQQKVNNMNVFASSSSPVTTGTGIATGNIEMWSNCYWSHTTLGLPGATGSYDYDDAIHPSLNCYGSFQVHNWGTGETILAYNRWSGGSNSDLGIGNSPTGSHPDWTFRVNANQYSVKRVHILVSGGGAVGGGAACEDIVVDNAPGQCGAVVTYNPTAFDNCSGAVNVVCNPPSGTLFPVGTTPVVCTATDAAGNSSTCGFTVTVNDIEAPSIAPIADIVVNNDPGVCGAAVDFDIAANDNCGVADIVSSVGSGTVFPIGSTTIDVVVTDVNGNSSSTSFAVTVKDAEAPVITPVADIVTNNDPGVCGATVSFALDATDNCGIDRIYSKPASGTQFKVGSTPVTIIAYDVHGNHSLSRFNVTVIDNEAPIIAPLADIAVNNAPGTCGAVVEFSASATDNCQPNLDPRYLLRYQRLLAAYQARVLAYQTELQNPDLTDEQRDSLQGKLAATLVQIENVEAEIERLQSLGVTVTAVPASGSVFPVGDTEVTVTAIDEAGNSSAAVFTVTVTDNEAPVIAPVSNITVGNDPGVCGAIAAYSPTATDNCGVAGVTTDIPSGTEFPVGTTTVTITATDIHGNSSSSSFDVTVEDLEAPVIAPAAADQTVECDGAGNNDALNAWLAANGGASATDNCEIAGWSNDFAGLSDGCGATGSATVTFTVTDIHGNSSSTSATFTIVDTTAPELSWSLNGAAVNEGDAHTIQPNQTPVTVNVAASDLCGGADINALNVTFHKVNGAGKVIDKTADAEFTIVGGTLTILDAAGVGTIITITASGADECGNVSAAETMVINVVNPGQGAAVDSNEGVGNGVDGDTPGHDNNGGNDDPGTSPGNPGAKGGKKNR